MNLYVKRSGHPFLTATYVNGYVKDVPLHRKDLAGVIHAMNQTSNTSGLKRGARGLR